MHWRNNLMLGENSAPAIFSVTTFTNYTSSDYNGFRPNPGATVSFQWNSPPRRSPAGLHRTRSHARRCETRQFATLAEYAKATGQDQHSVLVDYDVFVNVPTLDAQDAATVQKLYKAEDVRLPAEAGFSGRSIAASRCRTSPMASRDARRISARSKSEQPSPHYGPRP